MKLRLYSKQAWASAGAAGIRVAATAMQKTAARIANVFGRERVMLTSTGFTIGNGKVGCQPVRDNISVNFFRYLARCDHGHG